jgi:hypothetical protein
VRLQQLLHQQLLQCRLLVRPRRRAELPHPIPLQQLLQRRLLVRPGRQRRRLQLRRRRPHLAAL